MRMEQVEGRRTFHPTLHLRRPEHPCVLDTVLCQIVRGTSRRIDLVTMFDEHPGSIQHLSLLLSRTSGKQHRLLGYPMSYGEHRLQQGCIRIVADTAHLTRRSHIHTQHRVSLLQAVKRELRSLDTHIVEVEEVLMGLLDRQPEHHFRSQVDQVHLGNLTRDTLDAAHGLHIEFLRWELDGGIARVDTSELNMF